MKHTITIAYGGDTSEFEVSLCSTQEIYSSVGKKKYTLYIIKVHGLDRRVRLLDGTKAPVGRDGFNFKLGGEKMVLDFIYITIRGTPNEDRHLWGCLNMLHMPYSCCEVLAATLTCDKFACNQYLRASDVRIVDSLLLRQEQSVSDGDVIGKIELPCFIKPSLGGFNFSVTKVKTGEEIQSAIGKTFKGTREVLVEAFMQGMEITCGCYKTKEKSMVFPITEVVSHNEYFGYKTKYNGESNEITSARIPDELRDRVQKPTSAIYDILGAAGIIRMDYIITEREKVNLLEVSTTPDMTATSFIPQQVRVVNLDIKDIMTDIIENRF